MHKIIRFIKITLAFTRNRIQVSLAYIWGSLAWIVNGSIYPLVNMSIWIIVGKFGNTNMSVSQTISYFFYFVIFERITQTWSLDHLGDDIKSGRISNSFLRPYHHIQEIIAVDLGDKVSRLLALVPYVVLLIVLFKNQIIFISPHLFMLLIPASIFGYVARLLLDSILGTITYWTGDIDGIRATYWTIGGIATGALIPFFLFPASVKAVLNLLPFRYFISFPIEIILGQLNTIQILQGFIILLLWVITLLLSFILVDKISSKQYVAHGG